jgi:hypothetical protein
MIRAIRMRLSQCGGSGELLLSGLVPAGSIFVLMCNRLPFSKF